MEELLARYTPDERSVISRFMDKLARATRETGKISEPRKGKIIASFAEYDADVVIASLTAYIGMDIPAAKGGKGKNEKYVRGIMANKQAEKDRKAGGGGGGLHGGRFGADGRAHPSADGEGERLQRIAGDTSGGSLECDF